MELRVKATFGELAKILMMPSYPTLASQQLLTSNFRMTYVGIVHKNWRSEKRYLQMKKRNLWYHGYPSGDPHLDRGYLPFHVSKAHTTTRLRGRPRNGQKEYTFLLDYVHLEIAHSELERVSGYRDGWVSLLNLIPQQSNPNGDDGWMDGFSFTSQLRTTLCWSRK